jgi:peptide/nickel transport system permease protein
MFAVLAKRILISIPLLFLTSVITFVLQAVIPGDPARAIVGVSGSTSDYERVREQLHLNQPLWHQYGDYIANAVHGNLGTSIFTGVPVTQTLATRLPVTLALLIGATALCAIIGVVLGALSARIGGWLARLVDVFSLAGLALPNFWLALILISIFAIALPLFPATGYVTFADNPHLWLSSLVLPVVALAIGGIAQVAKITRDGIADALEQDYIRTLRASGVPERALLWKHALKNTGVPIVTVLGLVFVGALSGSLFIENVFVLPGLGSLVNDATNQHDIPVIQGVALAYTLMVIAVNILVDVAYLYLNPKARTS